MPDIFAKEELPPVKDSPIERVKKNVNLHHNGRIRIFELEFDFIGDDLVEVSVIGA